MRKQLRQQPNQDELGIDFEPALFESRLASRDSSYPLSMLPKSLASTGQTVDEQILMPSVTGFS